jgi:gliding motility-associated-like protein
VSYPPGISGNFQYTLTVMDGTCTETTTVNVTVNPMPMVTITGDAAICQGSNGMLSATPGYNSYSWSPFGSGQTINISSPGLYTVTVTGAGGCQNTASFNVVQTPSPTPVITGPSQLCPGATEVLSAGPGYDTYQWQDGSSDPTLNITGPGTYSVTVSQNGCQGVASITVAPGQSVPVLISGNTSLCAGSNTTLDAGFGYSSYLWQDGSSMQTLFVDTPGNYSVTVTDASGCTGTASVTVTQTPPFTPAISGDFSICTGSPAFLEAAPTYSAYQWSTGETNSFITPPTPGTYILTVTDASGCQGINSVTVQSLPDPFPAISGNLEICPGQSTTLSTTPNYVSYNWSTGSTNLSTNVSTPGPVLLTVTDVNGCQGTNTIDVLEGQPPQVNISGATTICSSNPLQLSATPGYVNYLWSTGSNNSDIFVNAPGTYILTVTNQAGCETVVQHTITPVPAPDPIIDGNLSICNGSSTLLSVTGGLYDQYLWSDGSTGPTTEVLSPGLVSVTVTDAAGCEGSTSVTVTNSPAPAVNISGNPQICENGTTLLQATPGYSSYLWSDGTPGAEINVNTSGYYEVTVTNAEGCEGTASISVEQLPTPLPTLSGATSFCEGQSAQLTVDQNYVSYQWYDGQTGATATISIEGPASVTVTDANGCQGVALADLIQSPSPDPSITGPVGVCEGEMISLDAGSGYSTYLWEDQSTTQLYQPPQAGTYSVTVTNAEGCEGTTSITVDQYDTPMPAIFGDPSICPGIENQLIAEGGYATYTWQDGTEEPMLDILLGGTYSLTVTDENGCEGQASITVVENPPLEPEISGTESLCEGQNTELSLPANYSSYSWNDGSTGATLLADTTGTYSVTVTDAEGCSGADDIQITVHSLPDASITGLLSFCADGQTTLSAPADASTYLWSDGSTDASITVSEADTYHLTVTDENGCQNTSSVLVQQVDELLPQINGPAEFCAGTNTLLTAEAGYSTYWWTGGNTTEQLSVDTAGIYQLIVTDANGCQGTTSVEVVENALPVVSFAGAMDFCSGDSTQLTASSGFENYEWQDGSTLATTFASTPGSYSLTVTDENGCQNEAVSIVSENPLPVPQISGELFFCPGTSTELSTDNTYAAYEWSTGASSPAIIADSVSSYALTVTDQNGCRGSTSVSINEYVVAPPAITAPDEFCPGTTATLEGAAGYQNYIWSNNSLSQNIAVEEPGDYTLTATDQNGCTASSSIAIQHYLVNPPQISGLTEFCEGSSTVLTADSGFQQYIWSDDTNGSQISISSGGFYELTVTDEHGCQSSSSVQVVQNNLPEVVIGGSSSFCTGGFTTLNAGGTYVTYTWSTGSEEASTQVSQIGAYTLTVTDANGCEGDTSIEVTEASELSPVISGPNAFCPGDTIVLDAGGGFQSYAWSDGSSEQQLEVEAAGDYTLTVTDEAGCSGSTLVSVSEYLLPSPAIEGETGFCEGSTTLLSAGGGDFTTVLWSDGSNSISLEVIQPGNYGLTVTDQNGCTASTTTDIISYPLPVFEIQGELTFCEGAATALSVTEGYTNYNWSNGLTGDSVEISSPGTYGLTVTSSEGCVQQDIVSVEEHPLPSPSIFGNTDFCPGTTTLLDAGSGYSDYQWSNGLSQQSIEISSPGVYQVTVMDAEGCIGQDNVTVNQWPAPQPEIIGEEGFCVGATTALQVAGGTFETFAWSNGMQTSTVSTGLPGLHTVTVTDNHSCQGTASISLTAHPLPDFTIEGITTFCEGSATTLSTSSDFAEYSWSDGSTASMISASQPGAYQLTVTSSFGCENVESVTLTSIPLPQADAGAEATINCYHPEITLGGEDSSTGDYTYIWTGPAITESNEHSLYPTVDQPGIYTLSVIDNQYGCTSVESSVEVVAQTQIPEVVLQVVDVLDCTTSSVVIDGSSSASSPSILYQWYDQALDPIPLANSNLLEVEEAALYYLLAVDTLNGCSSMDSVWVQEDEAYPVAEAGAGLELNCDLLSGSLDGSASQQGSTISYQWYTNDGAITQGAGTMSPTINQPGWYFIEVMDSANGCMNADSVLVTQDVAVPTVMVGQDQTIDCLNPTALLDATGSSTGPAFHLTWSLNDLENVISDQPITNVDSPGTYYLTIINEYNHCSSQASVNIDQIHAAPDDMDLSIDTPTCFGDADGSIQIANVSGGTAPYLYSLNGAPFGSTADFGQLAAGNYQIVVQDAIGCELSLQAVLEEGNDLYLDLGEDIEAKIGEVVTIQASTGIALDEIVAFNWVAADSLSCQDCLDPSVSPSQTGKYQLAITDDNGCTATDELLIFVDRRKDVYLPTAFSPNGDERNDQFFVQGGQDIVKIRSFQVFNRWGEPVFEVYNAPANDPQYGWDGTYRGTLHNSAVFTWFAEIEFIDGAIVLFKGDVALMR